MAMDQRLPCAHAAIEEASASLPPPWPFVLSAEYLRLIDRVEALPENRPGTDKTWTERALESWKVVLRNIREVPRA